MSFMEEVFQKLNDLAARPTRRYVLVCAGCDGRFYTMEAAYEHVPDAEDVLDGNCSCGAFDVDREEVGGQVVCSEPDGNEPTPDGRTAHELMVALAGQCPWCLEEV